MHERAARLRRELREGGGRVHALVRAPEPDAARVPDVHATAVLAERLDRLGHGLGLVGHDQVLVELVDRAQARARFARALRRVEAEHARLEFLERALGMVGAREVLAEPVLGPAAGAVIDQEQQVPAAGLERRLDALRQPLPVVRAGHDAVDDGIDRVGLVAAEAEGVLAAALLRIPQFDDRAVHARTHEPGSHHLLEDVLVEALAGAHERCAHHELLASTRCKHRLHDLRGCRGRDRVAAHVARLVAVPAGRRAAPRPQQSEVVVDLRRRGDRRARAVPARALLDGDRRGQAVHRLDVGLLHLVEELARVRAQALHVLALALGEDRVEGQAALAAPRHAGDHHELVARNVHREAAEVVFAGAANANALVGVGGRHGRSIIGSSAAKIRAIATLHKRNVRPSCRSRRNDRRPQGVVRAHVGSNHADHPPILAHRPRAARACAHRVAAACCSGGQRCVAPPDAGGVARPARAWLAAAPRCAPARPLTADRLAFSRRASS